VTFLLESFDSGAELTLIHKLLADEEASNQHPMHAHPAWQLTSEGIRLGTLTRRLSIAWRKASCGT
jgi:hypothetical protein